MRVKIVSDGTVFGTKILDADTGEVIRGLNVKRIIIDVDGPDGYVQVEYLTDDALLDITTIADAPQDKASE